jgi:membrane protease YdiL (CAAX protease family)
MNDSEPVSPGNGGAPPQAPLPGPPRFPLESVFLGPAGVRSGWRAALYVAVFVLFVMVSNFLHLFPAPAETLTPALLFGQESMASVCAIGAALVLGRLEGRRFGDYGMPWSQAFRGKFWLGALWGTATISALVLLIRALGGYSFGAIALSPVDLARYALEWAAVFLLVGVYEEFFFRGYLQFTLTAGIGFWPAALLTSVLFGAVHLRNQGESPIGAVSVFVTGAFLCLTLRRTGSLWFAIGWHAAYDFGETYLFSVPNSGIVMPGHLLASSFHGPAWLTGGTVGPEGSALDFVVMALLFAVFDRVYRARKTDSSLRSE